MKAQEFEKMTQKRIHKTPKILPRGILIFVFCCFAVQMSSLISKKWAIFDARTDLGKPQEHGYYGLWSLCSYKAPHWTQDCDSLDTFFEIPPYTIVSEILAIIHVIALTILIPLAILRVLPKRRCLLPRILLDRRYLCIIKVALAFASVMFAIMIAIFISIHENRNKEYTVTKGWAFWCQIAVIVLDIILSSLCAIQTVLAWRQFIREEADPIGIRAETYENPAFESIGYFLPPMEKEERFAHCDNFSNIACDLEVRPSGQNTRSQFRPSQPVTSSTTVKNKNLEVGTITYENPAFQSRSPKLLRQND